MSETGAAGREYPVQVRGRLEEPLSRWLWLVKWLLLLPHYVVLVFLWAAFAVVTVVAFFAILVTGRYPHGLFHFNVGVLRWSWRVAYYGYSALGTDRYPPFTLAEAPEYPATLDIAYPERLSRGLALVKWWLLAVPHYVVLAFLVGNGTLAWTADTARDRGYWTAGSAGLIAVLAFFVGVAILFTARYPRGLYDLLLGLSRWVYRVVAYAALMTDAYPPFRLDQGGSEPGSPGQPPAAPPAGAGAGLPATGTAAPAAVPASGTRPAMPSSPGAGRRSAGAAIALVVGLLALLPGVTLTGVGTAGLWLDAQRDAAGFVSTDPRTLTTPTAAITAEDVELHVDRGTSTWVSPDRFGTIRVRAATTDGSSVFVGVAPQAEVDAWLGPVAHDEVRNVGYGSVSYQRHSGQASAPSPADQTFWEAAVSGAGTQELSWPIESGRWAVVIARADGAPGVEARVDVGMNIPSLTGISAGLLVTGLVLLGIAVVLIAVGATGLGRRTAGPSSGPGPGPRPAIPPPGPRSAPTVELRSEESARTGPGRVSRG